MEVLISKGCFSEQTSELDIEKAAVFAMSALDLPTSSELSVTLVDNDEMAELNMQYRGKEGPTDVLSFECDNLEDEFSAQEFFAEDEVYSLGDIVIAPDVAKVQSEQFGTTFKAEMELLLFHGILHLCGYDHIEDDDALIMEKKQNELLEAWRSLS